MTEELKTLNEVDSDLLIFYGACSHCESIDYPAIKGEDHPLKKEAIKEVKFLRKVRGIGCEPNEIEKYFEYSCMACSEGCGMCGTEIIEKYIMWKNNLAEEELK